MPIPMTSIARLMLATTLALSSLSVVAQDKKPDLAKGEASYTAVCAACHGADGTGNTMLGAPNLTDDAWLYGASLADIEQSIRNGRQGVMPAHKDLLSEEKIHVLAAYVISLSKGSAAQ